MAAPQLWKRLYQWLVGSLTGTGAPQVHWGAVYDAGLGAAKVTLVDPSIAWQWQNSTATAVTTGTVLNYLNAASGKKPRLSQANVQIVAGVDDAVLTLDENTSTLGSPVWTVRRMFVCKASQAASYEVALPDVPFGPAGDGATDAHVRVQIASGTTPKCWAAFLAREA